MKKGRFSVTSVVASSSGQQQRQWCLASECLASTWGFISNPESIRVRNAADTVTSTSDVSERSLSWPASFSIGGFSVCASGSA